MTSDGLLTVKELNISFGTHVKAVNQLSFTLHPGKTLGIVGESGSGKSMTALALMGLLPREATCTAKQLSFMGKSLSDMSLDQRRLLRGRNMGMIFQEPMTSLNPVMTIGNQLKEVFSQHCPQMSSAEIKARCLELLAEVKLPQPHLQYDKYPHQISGGQKQRVMIAMAMALRPSLLLCDEPTTALDVTVQKQILELLKDLQQKYQMAMIFITHDLGVISHIAQDLLVMYRGEVVEYGTTKDCFHRPQHPYTKGLLECRPKLSDNRLRLPVVADFLAPDVLPTQNINLGGVLDAQALNLSQFNFFEKNKNFLPASESQSSFLLEVNNLSCTYTTNYGAFKAVKEATFSIERGKTLGLVGESGCGKTTIGRTLLLLSAAQISGEIKLAGQEIAPQRMSRHQMMDYRKSVQMIFQDPYSSLNPRLKVEQILLEPLQIHYKIKSRHEQLEWVKYLLHRVGLPLNSLQKYPHEFSGGQRQRICIARALALGPSLLICDECVSALDVSVQAQVLNLLLDLQEDFGLTYLFISHDLAVVNFMSDRVAVMQAGEIVEYEDSEQIYQAPKSLYTQNLLAAILAS